jgi:hypothetical protein
MLESALALLLYTTLGLTAGLYAAMKIGERDSCAFYDWWEVIEFVTLYLIMWFPIMISGEPDIRDGL